ncbi:MAG: flagellar hook-associated protein FlgK [Rhodospirillaceae bacterium]|jgi:flagellar hook-associated protein 1|nr:flagellar hook-associated protein FlgK [Rhodospirillaceae bacterium]MBT5666943.1 flagellar hook-associated protein FlgK [Rhodospirillaceae bacterium]
MTLSIALRTALSGIQAQQTALQISANNISNANTEGYTRKEVEFTPRRLGADGAGVEISAITRAVDEFLQAEIRSQSATVGRQYVLNNFLSELQGILGPPSGDQTIATNIVELNSALETLALSPESGTGRFNAVNEARKLTTKLNQLSELVQTLRAEADQSVKRSVDAVQAQLTLIQSLNQEVARAQALGEQTGELRDQRDIALGRIAEEIDIRAIENTNGVVTIFSTGGTTLLNEGSVFAITHSAAASFDASVAYLAPGDPNFPGPITGIFVGTPDTTNGTNDITNRILNGKLKAEIDLRDSILPNFQAELDRLSDVLTTQLNSLHNQGTAFPPPATLTGTQPVVATDAFTATGNVRISILNQNTGAVVESVDINLGGLGATATVADVVTAINAGLTGTPASINANGELVLQALTAGQGVAINERDSAVTVAGGQTRGFSHYFGLNDFFDVTANTSQYTSFATTAQNSSTVALGLAGTLNFRFDNTVGVNVAYVAGDTLEGVAAKINAAGALSAQNITATVETESGGRRLVVRDTGSDNFVMTDGGALLSTLNMASNSTSQTAIISVRATIAQNPDLLSRGTLNATAVVGATGLSVGDGTTANNMAGVFSNDIAFGRAGSLAGTTTTVARFTAQIIEFQAALTSDNRDEMEFNEVFKETLEFRKGNNSGVSIDEELANIIILQQAFGAAARAFTVTSEMFDTLINTVR